MAQRLDGINPLAYLGVKPYQPPELVVFTRNPTINDVNFVLGTIWLVKGQEDLFMLASLEQGEATWIQIYPQGGGGGGVEQVETDSGTANQVGGVFQFLAGTNINTSSPSTNIFQANLNNSITLSGTLAVAGTTTLNGTLRLPRTPTSYGTLQADSIGTVAATNGTKGQILVSRTGTYAIWGDITSADNSVSIDTTTNGVIDLSVAGDGSLNLVSVYRQSNYLIPATEFIIPWDGVTTNVGGAMNAATGIFTAPRTGTYVFNATICLIAAGVSSNPLTTGLNLPATTPTTRYRGGAAGNNGGALPQSWSLTLPMSMGDTAAFVGFAVAGRSVAGFGFINITPPVSGYLTFASITFINS